MWAMSKARLVITAVVVEGRTHADAPGGAYGLGCRERNIRATISSESPNVTGAVAASLLLAQSLRSATKYS